MKTTLKRGLAILMVSGVSAWAGALTLQVTSADTNAEAKSMKAALVAQVTACLQPEKSVVSGSVVQLRNGEMQRTPLKVVPLKTAGMFAVIGEVPEGSVVDLAVSNPLYKGYEPRVLVHKENIRRFFGAPPTDADFKVIFGE